MTKAEAAALAKPVEPAGKKKLDVPPMPPKPDYARPRPTVAPVADSARRRSFLSAAMGVLFGSSLAIGFSSLAATHLMWGLGLARFMFPNILIEPPTRFKVGFPDTLAPGQVETKFIAQFGVWIVKYEFEGQAMVYALKSVCTHLGCTPNWLESEQKFPYANLIFRAGRDPERLFTDVFIFEFQNIQVILFEEYHGDILVGLDFKKLKPIRGSFFVFLKALKAYKVARKEIHRVLRQLPGFWT